LDWASAPAGGDAGGLAGGDSAAGFAGSAGAGFWLSWPIDAPASALNAIKTRTFLVTCMATTSTSLLLERPFSRESV
jgi:hypothetical protein